jgi:hypothetical protein
MEIKIKTLEDCHIILTNNELNNNNCIDLIFVNDKGSYTEAVTVPIDELHSAILAFNNLRDEQNKREREYGYLEVK